MHVALLNQDAGITLDRHKGAAVHLGAMRDAFADLGASVSVISETEPDRLEARLEADCRIARIDLLYERYALGRSAGAEFSARRGIPFVLEVNAPLADEARIYRRLQETEDHRQRDLRTFGEAAAVVAVSHQVAAYALARGARPETVHVFPNGVDVRRFVPRGPGDALREALVPPGRFALGFHGRLRPWHGFENLARIAGTLLERGNPIHVVTVGVGDFDRCLETFVPPEHRTVVGWIPHAEVASYVATFDALPVTPSAAQPFYFCPLKVAESLACGVVPIVPALGDLAVIVGEAGVVYPPDDWARVVDTVEWLIRDVDGLRGLAERARERAIDLSWDRVAAFALSMTVQRDARER